MSDAEYDWSAPLALLHQAYDQLMKAPPRQPGEARPFDSYVDVGSDLQALEQIIEDVAWETWQAAGRPGDFDPWGHGTRED